MKTINNYGGAPIGFQSNANLELELVIYQYVWQYMIAISDQKSWFVFKMSSYFSFLFSCLGGMGGYIGGHNQYWSAAGNTINLANLPTLQSYPTSVGSINYSNAGSSYIASSQPAMTYSQISSRNTVMSGQHSRSYQSGYSKNGCSYRWC